jgi:hemoglobin
MGPNKSGRRRSRIAGCILAALVAALLLTGISFAGENDKPAKTLYQRMGGYDVLAGIVDDFLTQLGKDPAFNRFGGGRSEGSLKRTRQIIVDQFCALTGGPCSYIGRDMKSAHHGLKITRAEWDSAIKKLELSLDKFKVNGKDKEEFVAMIQKVRDEIVEAPEAGPKAEKSPGQD